MTTPAQLAETAEFVRPRWMDALERHRRVHRKLFLYGYRHTGEFKSIDEAEAIVASLELANHAPRT